MSIPENSSIAEMIQSLLLHLPRFAEEEGDHYRVKRSDLIDALCREKHIEPELAGNTVSLCEALLDTLAVLRTEDLQRGEWCFVSFPAQLMALSVLTALGDSDSRFFEADFWNTQGISNDKKDRQREVLRVVENRRNECHLTHSATSILFIHVAWSVIKHDGKILFYQREDTKIRHERNAGDYGLIGGRVNQKDLPHANGNIKRQLQILQSADIERVKPALTETLKRELLEEAGLVYDQHYVFKPWRSLKPYRQVQGTAPNHALTEYFITLYTIELNLEGFCHLQHKLAADERLILVFTRRSSGRQVNKGRQNSLPRSTVSGFRRRQVAFEAGFARIGRQFQRELRHFPGKIPRFVASRC